MTWRVLVSTFVTVLIGLPCAGALLGLKEGGKRVRVITQWRL
ncbi:hypothetical protein OCO_19740 [Mycobacterium intracellulare MOTT-02]|jgi:hypothetical protein|nr:hypothetical protein OCO_19740 [Mycobacterium intracellulare MOTT-02]